VTAKAPDSGFHLQAKTYDYPGRIGSIQTSPYSKPEPIDLGNAPEVFGLLLAAVLVLAAAYVSGRIAWVMDAADRMLVRALLLSR
jgi:hypothetical protein